MEICRVCEGRESHWPQLAKRYYRRRDEYGLLAGRWLLAGCVEFAWDGPEGRDFKRTFIPVNSFGIFDRPYRRKSPLRFLMGLILKDKC